MPAFKTSCENWVNFRSLSPREIDLHYGRSDGSVPYWERMAKNRQIVIDALEAGQRDNVEWVLFRHGASTSRLGATTTRSVVRGVMRSSDATPYIIRKECIQHETIFLARIRQNRLA